MNLSRPGVGVLVVNLCATWFLVGLIWVVQVVHYPLFAKVSPDLWSAYHQDHVRLITFLIAPVMFIETMSAAALVFVVKHQASRIKWAAGVAVVLVLICWLSTAGIQVPLHNKLAIGFDPNLVRELVLTNWVRTAGWSIRGLLVGYIAWQLLLGNRQPTSGPARV